MGYQLHWFEKEVSGYYLSGAISKDFDLLKENEKLAQWVNEEKEIIAVFENERNMLLLKEFALYSESLEEGEELFYLLDEDLIDFIHGHLSETEPDLSLYVGVIALQYFQFDTLKDVLDLSEEDLENVSPEEREDVRDVQKIFKDMDPEEREIFLEQELFCYTKSELTQWLENLALEEGD